MIGTASEKLRKIVQIVDENWDSYVPSIHVLYFYYEMGQIDLQAVRDTFKPVLRTYIDNFKIATIEEVDFFETDPGPMFYVDLASVQECFQVIEYKLISATVQQMASKMMGEVDSEPRQLLG